MPAPLETFIHQLTSGHNVLSPEMYAHFGGDDILAELQKYDPNAKFSDVQYGGQDSTEMGKRLDVDLTKLPTTKAGAVYEINPRNLTDKVRSEGAVYDDPVYGKVTASTNSIKASDPLWTKLAPLLVSMGGPAMAGALAGMGIGAAGLTGAVTGSGLSGAATKIPGWLAGQMTKLPSYAGQLAHGNLNIDSLIAQAVSGAAGAAGVDPNLVKGGLTLAQIARQRR